MRPYYLLATKGYGFTVDDIDWSCPTDLEPYVKAYKLQLKQNDAQLHTMGIYALSAFSTVLDRCFNGGKSKVEYIKNPILSEQETKEGKEKKEMTEEKRKELENQKLALTLRAMQANFEINKKRKLREENLCRKEQPND